RQKGRDARRYGEQYPCHESGHDRDAARKSRSRGISFKKSECQDHQRRGRYARTPDTGLARCFLPAREARRPQREKDRDRRRHTAFTRSALEYFLPAKDGGHCQSMRTADTDPEIHRLARRDGGNRSEKGARMVRRSEYAEDPARKAGY